MAEAPEPLERTLARLREEREEADRRYNDALTAVDRALAPAASLPAPRLALDDERMAALNEAWNTLPSAPALGGGLKGRLARLVWRLAGPPLERQLTFNSLLVDHLNRNAAAERASHDASISTAAAIQGQLASLAEFQARLIGYLQQITAYVDTKDRESAGGALVLNAALSALAENTAKRWESLAARDQRYQARTAAVAAAHDDLRSMIGVSQQGLLALKREVERLLQAPASAGTPAAPGAASGDAPRGDAFAPTLDAYKYVGFEDQFRGSRAVIRERLESYVPFFAGATDVLDVGCGRGEFLDLLAAHGIRARGIDLNHEMAEVCRARGLDVTEADAVGYLSSRPDADLGGIFAAQVVEHLDPAYLLRFLELAFHKLRPGGRLVLETLNPACWVAFFESYIRDITHRWPLHPETLKYLVVASGFTRADVEFRSPVPEQDRLQPVTLPEGAGAALADLAEAFNANVEKLNARMFTHLDYAVIGQKGTAGAGAPAGAGSTSDRR